MGDLRTSSDAVPTTRPGGRVADAAAVLRVMRPLHSGGGDDPIEQRQLLADLFRLIGRPFAAPPPAGEPTGDHGGGLEPPAVAGPTAPTTPELPPAASKLPPRMGQTLDYLLTGDSEKQVAQRLNLSPHTVHVYVKKLYRHFDVSSRAELLALHLRR